MSAVATRGLGGEQLPPLGTPAIQEATRQPLGLGTLGRPLVTEPLEVQGRIPRMEGTRLGALCPICYRGRAHAKSLSLFNRGDVPSSLETSLNRAVCPPPPPPPRPLARNGSSPQSPSSQSALRTCPVVQAHAPWACASGMAVPGRHSVQPQAGRWALLPKAEAPTPTDQHPGPSLLPWAPSAQPPWGAPCWALWQETRCPKGSSPTTCGSTDTPFLTPPNRTETSF